MVLFHWPGNIHFRSDDFSLKSTKPKELKIFKSKYICAQRSKIQEQNCKKNCPITSIFLTEGLDIRFIRDPREPPIIDLLMHPDFPCFNRWKQLPIIDDDYYYLLHSKSIQNWKQSKFIQDITKQCEEPLQDIYHFQNITFYSAVEFIEENLDFEEEEIDNIAHVTLRLLAERKMSMKNAAECRQFDKDKVTIAEIIIKQMIILFWVFQLLKILTFVVMTMLELVNYNVMNQQLDSLKYSLGITCLLLIGNLFENFLISDQFRKLHMIVRYYANFGLHDCFKVSKLNEYFGNTERFLAGRSHGYEFIINVHFYIVAILIGVFIGIIFIRPQQESSNHHSLTRSFFWQEQLKQNRVAVQLKYKQSQISEHNSEDSFGSHKQLVEMQTI